MSTSNIRCQIGHMRPSKPISDTMPKRGKVTEMCKEWLVHEDGALAYQLQQQEVEKHYSGNKSRNAIVREDFPMALDAQRKAQDEASAEYFRQVKLIEERDAQVAREIAEKLKMEEDERRRLLEVQDLRVARVIQERDRRAKLAAAHLGDANAVGLPLPTTSNPLAFPDGIYDAAVAHAVIGNDDADRSPEPCYENLPPPPLQLKARRPMMNIEQGFTQMKLQDENLKVETWSRIQDADELSKADQEKRDEELAKRLQLEEQSAEFDMLDRDRMLAIEVQDLELAKMLQEKEKARLRRAKEKARAKALAKKLTEDSLPSQMSRDLEEAQIEHREENSDHMMNIATAIDPTYVPPMKGPQTFFPAQLTPPRSMNRITSGPGTSNFAVHTHSPTHSHLHTENLLETSVDDSPPYMPVQGQRRTSSIEKKKKKSKDSGDCKQQ